MNKQIVSKKKERLHLRTSEEDKSIIMNYCEENGISFTDFALKAMYNEMKRSSFESEVQAKLEENAFYNYVAAYSSQSPAVRKMINSYKRGDYNHEA